MCKYSTLLTLNLGHCLIWVFHYLIHPGQQSIQDFFIVQSCCWTVMHWVWSHVIITFVCLKRWDVLSQSLGGSWPDPPWAMLSGTAFPLPLSGITMLYSHSTSLMLGDSCAPASDPPPVGGGFVMMSWSPMPLVPSSRTCELMLHLSGSLLTVLLCYCVTV